MFCTKCGNKLNQEQKFCTNCGATASNENMKVSENFKCEVVFDKDADKVKNINGSLKNKDLHNIEVKSKVVNNKGIDEEKYQKTDNSKWKNKIIIATSIIVLIGLAATVAYVIKSKHSDKSNAVNEKVSEDKVDNKKEELNITNDNEKDDKPQDNNMESKWELDKERLDKSPKLKNDYVINTSNTTRITFLELNDYTIDEIFVARNEMLARYGYSFTGKENLKKYFQSKSWYKENPKFDGIMPSEVEALNLEMLGTVEYLKKAYEKSGDIKEDYVLSESNRQVQSESRISELTDWELIIARNEIYARYGLNFSTSEIKNHFLSKSWFKINDEVGNDLALTEIENKNLQLILVEEKKRMNIAFDHDL